MREFGIARAAHGNALERRSECNGDMLADSAHVDAGGNQLLERCHAACRGCRRARSSKK
jgi:hypothetical protein